MTETLHDLFSSIDCGRWWNKHGQHEAFIGHTTLHQYLERRIVLLYLTLDTMPQYYSLVQLYHASQISSQWFKVNKASIDEYDNGSSKLVSKGLKIL